jgi:flagellar hook-associated protein 2
MMSKAKDAKLVYGDINTSDGLVLTSSTNTFKGVINGIDLTITGVSDSPVTITSASSSADVKVILQQFVESYNAFREQLNEDLWFVASDKGINGNILWNSAVARDYDREVTNLLMKTFDGIPGIRSLADLGITIRQNFGDVRQFLDSKNAPMEINKETNKLEFDESVFEEAWARDSEAMMKFFINEVERVSPTGEKYTVNIGYAQLFSDLTDRLTGGPDIVGKTPARLDALTFQIDRNEQRIAFMEERLEFKRQMYLKQFYAMEQAMSRMSADMSAVTNIASSWSSNYNSGS